LGYATVKGADALEAIIKPLRRGDIPGFYSRVDEADEVIRTVIREKWIEKLPEDANRIAGIVKWIEEIRLAIREAVDEQLEKLAKEADKATVYDTFLKKAQHLKNTAKSVLKDALDGFRNMPSWLKAWWLMDTLPFLVWAITNEATSWFIERPYWEAKDKIDNIERLYFTAKDALEAGELDKVEEIIENLENAINDLRNHIEANKSAFTTTGVYDTYIDTVNYYEDVLGVLKLSALIDVPEEIKGIRVETYRDKPVMFWAETDEGARIPVRLAGINTVRQWETSFDCSVCGTISFKDWNETGRPIRDWAERILEQHTTGTLTIKSDRTNQKILEEKRPWLLAVVYQEGREESTNEIMLLNGAACCLFGRWSNKHVDKSKYISSQMIAINAGAGMWEYVTCPLKRITITSTPSAKIYLDGKYKGTV